MRIWIPVNGPKELTEDTAYLIGRISARFNRIIVSHVADDATSVPAPPEPVDIVFHRLRNLASSAHREVGRHAAALGVPVSNPIGASLRSYDKRTLVEDFPDLIPPTRIIANMTAFHDAFELFGGDVVVKEPFGYGGKQVRRVTSRQDEAVAAELLAEAQSGEIVVQPFMPGFAEGDRRIIVVRGTDGRHRPVAGLTRRPPPGGWLCNISSGGSAVIEDASCEEAAVAVAVAERSGLDIAQLDFGWDNGRFYLIETNERGGGFIDYDIGHRANCGDSVAEFLAARAGGC
jgi:glutathione synthase